MQAQRVASLGKSLVRVISGVAPSAGSHFTLLQGMETGARLLGLEKARGFAYRQTTGCVRGRDMWSRPPDVALKVGKEFIAMPLAGEFS